MQLCNKYLYGVVGLGRVRFMVGLNDFTGLSQPKRFDDYVNSAWFLSVLMYAQVGSSLLARYET